LFWACSLVPIPHSGNHDVKIGDAKVDVQTEHSDRLPPAVAGAFVAAGVFVWPEEAEDMFALGRTLTELAGIGPYLNKQILNWMRHPPELEEANPDIRQNFLTLEEASTLRSKYLECFHGIRGDCRCTRFGATVRVGSRYGRSSTVAPVFLHCDHRPLQRTQDCWWHRRRPARKARRGNCRGQPEVVMTDSGIAVDVLGAGLDRISREKQQAILTAFPRLAFKDGFKGCFVTSFVRNR
jgi:hypothetical protein